MIGKCACGGEIAKTQFHSNFTYECIACGYQIITPNNFLVKIAGFFNEYRFLSNFHMQSVHLKGIEYPSTEHAYQAAKTNDESLKKLIREAPTSKDAKRLSKKIVMSKEEQVLWDNKRYNIMYNLVKEKFQNPELKFRLLDTGNAELEETNWWGDTYWGVYKGKGENALGKILMKIREELRNG